MTKITVDKAMIEQAISGLLLEPLGVDHSALRQKLRAALAEPAAEHVVTLCVKRDEYKLTLHYKGEEVALDLPDGEYKLYTSPPPPAEVPMLTEHERKQILDQCGGWRVDPDALISDVEAAVRRKAGL